MQNMIGYIAHLHGTTTTISNGEAPRPALDGLKALAIFAANLIKIIDRQ